MKGPARDKHNIIFCLSVSDKEENLKIFFSTISTIDFAGNNISAALDANTLVTGEV
jgi:hypothetical protein